MFVSRIDVTMLRLFWLGVIEAKRPELSPLFFQEDLAPHILKFLCRPKGAFVVSEWNEGR